MTNQVVNFQAANLPAKMQARMAIFNVGSILSGLSSKANEVDKISIKAGRFRVKQVGMDEVVLNQLHLDGVIVYANRYLNKAYFSKAYDPNAEDMSPDCASSNGFTPDEGVKAPQSAQCSTCPQAVWGSKISPRGKKIRACGESQLIAILPIDPSTNNFFVVDGKPKAFRISVPGASKTELGEYANSISHRGFPVEAVLTRITFDTTTEFPKLNFALNAVLPDQAKDYISDYIGENEAKLEEVVGANGKPMQNVQVQPQVQQPAVQIQAPPVVQPQVQVQQVPPVQPVVQAPAPQAMPNFGGLGGVQPAAQPAGEQATAPATTQASPPVMAAAPAALLNALQGVMG